MFGRLLKSVHVYRAHGLHLDSNLQPYPWLGLSKDPLQWSAPSLNAIWVGKLLKSAADCRSGVLYPGETIEVAAFDKYPDVSPDEVVIYLIEATLRSDLRFKSLTQYGAAFTKV